MIDKKKVIAVIPARGGSKRIPKKNIKKIAGKPMIQWTIEAALGSRYIDRVIVSTDDQDIKEVSEKSGIEVPFFRKKSNDDFSPVSEATLECLIESEKVWGSFDIVVQLMPNCPLRKTNIINSGIEFFLDQDDSVISFFKFGWMNPWWAHKINDSGDVVSIFPDALNKRSQDLDPLYCPSGALWVSWRNSLVRNNTFYSDNYKPYVVDWKSGLDIDDYDDFIMAEAMLKIS